MSDTMAKSTSSAKPEVRKSILDSTFPVLLSEESALHLGQDDFQVYLRELLASRKVQEDADTESNADSPSKKAKSSHDTISEDFTEIDGTSSVGAEDLKALFIDTEPTESAPEEVEGASMEGKMYTENLDIAFRDTEPLVDLFFELEKVVSGPRLRELLENAWEVDDAATLKIIWNARSIHLGKASREAFYKACGWLAQNHPHTLVANLEWLTRPIIPKTAEKAKEGEDKDTVLLTSDGEETHDLDHGGAHGYWKDLLNLLMLAAHDQLHVRGDARAVLNIHNEKNVLDRDWDADRGKKRRHEKRDAQHAKVVEKLAGGDPVYKALHLTVARIFAQQLKRDMQVLESKGNEQKTPVSLAAKWAPSSRESHDRSTFVVSTIAEALYPQTSLPSASEDRATYLKQAREAYRFHAISPLRKVLSVVERDISSGTFEKIQYSRVPSIAMNRYQGLFLQKDPERFDQYLDQVATGRTKISGATMLPSKLIQQAMAAPNPGTGKKKKAMSLQKLSDTRVLEGQWNSLVQSIRDNGKLESSIAVCDVSGSMFGPMFEDSTTPLHSSIALSLILAEITEPPFGNSFITFSSYPKLVNVGGPDDKRTFVEKVKSMSRAAWGGSTDLVAVFEKLLLPRALELKTPAEDMVKQLFVFTDMHFNQATNNNRWNSSFERIQKAYKDAGYEMPQLIFWNLAGGRAGYSGYGDPTAPKPVGAEQPGVAMVNGYSASQMKMFLGGGQFDELEEGEQSETEEVEDEEVDAVVTSKKKEKPSMDPLSTVRKAIGHPAYGMLRVVD